MLDITLTIFSGTILAITYLIIPSILSYLHIRRIWIPDRYRVFFGIVMSFNVVFLLFLIAFRIAVTS